MVNISSYFRQKKKLRNNCVRFYARKKARGNVKLILFIVYFRLGQTIFWALGNSEDVDPKCEMDFKNGSKCEKAREKKGSQNHHHNKI